MEYYGKNPFVSMSCIHLRMFWLLKIFLRMNALATLFLKILVNQKFEIESNALRLKKLTNKVPVVIFQLRIKSQKKMIFDFFSNGMSKLHANYDPNILKDNPEIIFDQVNPEDIEAVRVSLEESIFNLKDWNVEYRIFDKKKGYPLP